MSMETYGKDMEWVRARCKEDGDCLLWRLSVNASGHPKYCFITGDGKKPSRQMRRIVWAIEGRPDLKPGQVVTATCGNPGCLNPDHLQQTTKRKVLKMVNERPATKVRQFVAGALNKRPVAKITMDQARYIRESEKTLTALAGELGVSVAWCSRIRRGEAWRELQASPFAGLMG